MLVVSGADLMNGTPILDIKPYLPFTDCHPEATGGFAEEMNRQIEPLEVEIPQEVAGKFSAQQLETLREVLAQDPRPHYQHDASRIYTMEFAGWEVKFRVDGKLLMVCDSGSQL